MNDLQQLSDKRHTQFSHCLYTPVHQVESVKFYGLSIGRCCAGISYTQVMHSALVILPAPCITFNVQVLPR